MEGVLLLIMVGMGFWIRDLLKRNLNLQKLTSHQRSKFHEMEWLVWDHAAFMDSTGKSEKQSQYNVEEVTAHWDKYHKICRDFNQYKIK